MLKLYIVKQQQLRPLFDLPSSRAASWTFPKPSWKLALYKRSLGTTKQMILTIRSDLRLRQLNFNKTLLAHSSLRDLRRGCFPGRTDRGRRAKVRSTEWLPSCWWKLLSWIWSRSRKTSTFPATTDRHSCCLAWHVSGLGFSG